MEHNKEKFKYYKIVMLVVLTAFITFLLTSIIMYSYMKNNEEQPEEIGTTYTVDNIDEAIQPYRNIIDKYYLGEIDENALIEGAIKGYVDGLNDPYTEYISKEEMQDYTEDLLGNFVGIGVYMVANTEVNRIQVLSPIKDSPAEKAGIQPGDYIIKVNDVEYTAEQMTEASNVIKGEEGTTVKLQLLREDKTANLSELPDKIESTRLSFASEERLKKYLNVEKGAVTPLAILFDKDADVEVIFDKDLLKEDVLGVHPGVNTKTVLIKSQDLIKYIEANKNKIIYI